MATFKQRIVRLPILGGLARRAAREIRRRRNSALIRSSLSLSPRRVVIGASGTFDSGWIPTEVEALNILCEADWRRFFEPDSIDALLAEHVWEHLTEEEGLQGAALCRRYLKPGGYLRIGVPDGNHPDPEYIEYVKIGGKGAGAADHKILFTYRTARSLFERAGFEVRLYEYFDEDGTFHYADWSPADGLIHRSKRFDKRNRDGRLRFTSIVLDAVKKIS
jgi:predicted SAM-dependent methyltransferase